MNIGDSFIYKSSGSHEPYRLMIIHDNNKNRRVLWNCDIRCRQDTDALLYAKPVGKAPKHAIHVQTMEFKKTQQ